MTLPPLLSTTHFGLLRTARFRSPTHRAELGRFWDDALPVIGFVGLNPGKADHQDDDATARKMVGFARRWGFGGYLAWNLFELVSTDPAGLWKAVVHGVPVNPERRDDWLSFAVFNGSVSRPHPVGTVCVAWGNPPPGYSKLGTHGREYSAWAARRREVLDVLRLHRVRVVVAAETLAGHPAHLSRLPYQGPREIVP